jgi:IMP cyclohydrolase
MFSIILSLVLFVSKRRKKSHSELKRATVIKEYPGRLIIIGQEKNRGNILAVYAITGRSASSQARKLVREAETIWVKPTDKDLLKQGNIELLIYPSVFCLPQGIAISNGKQSVDVMACLGQGESAAEVLAFALKNWDYEPDAPTFTPRISACILPNKSAALSLIKKASDDSTLRNIYEFSLAPGKGRMVMTYEGENIDPLPAYAGEPQEIDIEGTSAQEIAENVYESLAPTEGGKDFRVAVACVFGIDMLSGEFETHIINRSDRKQD